MVWIWQRIIEDKIMSKNNSRSQFTINRQSDEANSEDHWLKQFEQKLQKGAVQPRSNDNLFDQINSIMNGKSKYPSVQAAVDDMMQRSGLTAYLNNVKTSSPTVNKTAQVQQKNNVKMPKVIEKKPEIKKTLENIIKETKGNMPVPVIISRLHSLHANDISDDSVWEDEDLIKLVSKYNLQAKIDNPNSYENFDNLGKIDHSSSNSEIDISNTDAFSALTPAKI